MRAMLLCASLLLAGSAVAGPWVEGETEEASYLVTTNDDRQVLGQSCTLEDSVCRWLLLLENRCEPDKTITPALISAPAGGVATELVCIDEVVNGGRKMFRYGLSPFDAVDEVFRSPGAVGIAFPLESGKFRVVRFILVSGSAQLDKMRGRALIRSKAKAASTKSQTL